jgi:hypothetical protein
MNPKINFLIKIVATVVITLAIIAELANIYRRLYGDYIPSNFILLFWLGRLVLMAHFIEGIIAAISAHKQEKNFLIYGIYVFFVGTLGLLELFQPSEKPSSSPD